MTGLQDEIGALVGGPPGADEFAMWRAVFALAHVDGAVSPEEVGFVVRSMDVFKFSEEQRAVIYRDMTERGDVLRLFRAIGAKPLRAQFFRLARILMWCDGFFHEYEAAMIDAIKQDMGADAAAYEADLRWIRRKPDLPLGLEGAAGSPGDEALTHIMVQMAEFYKGGGREAA